MNVTKSSDMNTSRRSGNIFKRIFYFYYDGFSNMTVGKKLWMIIIIKLALFFLILKLLFFPDFLETNFSNDKERGDYVFKQLTTQE